MAHIPNVVWISGFVSNSISRGRFVEQKLMLSSNFRCDQIHNCHWYDLGHTLLWYLSQTQMFNKPTLIPDYILN